MKATELIQKLQELILKHGDLEVHHSEEGYGDLKAEWIFFKGGEKDGLGCTINDRFCLD